MDRERIWVFIQTPVTSGVCDQLAHEVGIAEHNPPCILNILSCRQDIYPRVDQITYGDSAAEGHAMIAVDQGTATG